MGNSLRKRGMIGAVIAGASLVTSTPGVAHSAATQLDMIQLLSTDAPASAPVPVPATDVDSGDGVALIMGPSGVSIPVQSYMDAAASLYLDPSGFHGDNLVPVVTPEGLNPITGPKSLTFDASAAKGEQILDGQILREIQAGYGTADHPIYVFGYSQSSVISAQLMPELSQQVQQLSAEHPGLSAANIHFVMVADESIPNGGTLSSFDLPPGSHPSVPALGLTISGPQPNDLFPTDVYTQEYDGFADFPRYPVDVLSTLNALVGIITQHITYLNLQSGQITDALPLDVSDADSLTHYFMIPSAQLPLLEPLLLLPGIGKPLYDLLEPDMRVLVDLGYGSLDEGWNQGPADVATPVGFLPPDINLGDLAKALADGAKTGLTDAAHDLTHPAPSAGPLLLDNPVLAHIVDGFRTWGLPLSSGPTVLELARALLTNFTGYPISEASLFGSPLSDVINSIGGTISGDIDNLPPFADTIDALLTTLPTAGVQTLLDGFKDGTPLQGVDEVIGGLFGLVPFSVFYGMLVPLANEVGGTLINGLDLVGLGDLQF